MCSIHVNRSEVIRYKGCVDTPLFCTKDLENKQFARINNRLAKVITDTLGKEKEDDERTDTDRN